MFFSLSSSATPPPHTFGTPAVHVVSARGLRPYLSMAGELRGRLSVCLLSVYRSLSVHC